MRILYLTNGFPFPLTSGFLRDYHFLRTLARAHRITLLSIVRPSFKPEHVSGVSAFVESVQTFTAAHRGASTLRKVAHHLRYVARDPQVSAMRAAVAAELQREPYDVVIAAGEPPFHAVRGLRMPPVITDMCDANSFRLAAQAPYMSVPRRLWMMVERPRVRHAEQHMLAGSQHVVFATERDRSAVVKGPSDRASVIPNGIDTEFWRRRTTQLGANAIVFTGAMSYPPNADAALFLARHILPLVRSRVRDAQLLLVGHSPGEEVRAAARLPGVTVTGFVSDVRPFLEEAAVFAAPLRFGAGIQNKLLEALSMEVPAVASPLAADGLTTEAGRAPIDRATTPAAFADAICRQLQSRAQDRSVHTQGRAYVEQHFSWDTSGARLDALVRAAAGSCSAPRVA